MGGSSSGRESDPFEDAALYDWEYRRRRDDVRFYLTLADERGGPIADLACGTGRIAAPLVKSGHAIVGVDRSTSMLARAAARIRRLGPAAGKRALLVRGDIRSLPLAGRFPFAIAAFHSVQHMLSDQDLATFFAGAAAALIPGGWLAFDLFVPTSRFLERAKPAPAGRPNRRWSRTVFRHPVSKQRLLYSESYRREDPDGGPNPDGVVLAMTFHYERVGGTVPPGRSSGVEPRRGGYRERRVFLRHRLLTTSDVKRILGDAGLTLIASWGGFDGRPLGPSATAPLPGAELRQNDDETEQHVYLARK